MVSSGRPPCRASSAGASPHGCQQGTHARPRTANLVDLRVGTIGRPREAGSGLDPRVASALIPACPRHVAGSSSDVTKTTRFERLEDTRTIAFVRPRARSLSPPPPAPALAHLRPEAETLEYVRVSAPAGPEPASSGSAIRATPSRDGTSRVLWVGAVFAVAFALGVGLPFLVR
jgi:hypothetical protein